MKASGKPVQLIESQNYNHFEMVELLANPYGPNGRAALGLMKLMSVVSLIKVAEMFCF